jgi:hypothetical protein
VGRQRLLVVACLVATLIAMVAGSAGSGAATGSVTTQPTTHVRTLGVGCSNSNVCHFAAGPYRLGPGTVLPGLRLTLQKGWSSQENWSGSLRLQRNNQNGIGIWLDMVAVKSSGPGHGQNVLSNVGKSPADLVRWLTHNPDFEIVSPPTAVRVAGVPATALTVGVSTSANYGDKGCPANPRCADLFTGPGWSDFYGIGGSEQVRLYLAAIKTNDIHHTLMLALDSPNHPQLAHLQAAAAPVIASLRLPKAP